MKPYLIILLAVCGFADLHPSVVRAQNGTSLPTSMYGIGELAAGDGGRYAGMGNVGIGVSRAGFLNTFNPAALTRMDSACFTFDVGVTAYYARYAFQNERSSSMEGGPNRFSFGFRLLPRWYMVVGVSPYSSVGYLIQTQEEIEGMPGASLTSVFRGEGGLYRAYVSQAFVLTPALSAGVCIGMLTGKVTQSETQEGATVSDESAKRSLYADFGLHYQRGRYGLGLVYAPSIRIGHDNRHTYENSSSTNETEDKSSPSRSQYLPMRLGAGVSVTGSRCVLALDYTYADWSRNVSAVSAMGYENQHKLNMGAIVVASPRRMRSVEWMGGIGLSNSYLTLQGRRMYSLEVSAGSSIPIGFSFLSLGATWRKQLNGSRHVMQESRFSLNLSLTFGERLSRSRLQ